MTLARMPSCQISLSDGKNISHGGFIDGGSWLSTEIGLQYGTQHHNNIHSSTTCIQFHVNL